MPITFNSLLVAAGFQLHEVRFLRHKDNRSAKGRSPYELWRDNRPEFDRYQSTQGIGNQSRLDAPYWAAFVGTHESETLFVGVYAVGHRELLDHDAPCPHRDDVDERGSCYVYNLVLEPRLGDLVGRLLIDWGPGDRSWIQRPDRQDKVVTELRTEFTEPAFPGFLNFLRPLSVLNTLPRSWTTTLRASRGIYLLTCPRTKEQYVGSASGEDGFWGRWMAYIETGHGDNIALKSRDPSDYQVSILEVAGSAHTTKEILEMEHLWKRKLQSQEMGLNRN